MSNQEIIEQTSRVPGAFVFTYEDAIKFMEASREDEAVRFGVFLLGYLPDCQSNSWKDKLLEALASEGISTEEMYSIFKQIQHR